jgi:prepilin-type N-terminal cleavage/methylation domain-containing protein
MRLPRTGFTLIEVIITLLMVGIVAAVTIPYLLTSLEDAAQPFFQLKDSEALQGAMANLVADYHVNFANDLSGLRAKVGVAPGSAVPAAYGRAFVRNNQFLTVTNYQLAGITTSTNCLQITITNALGEQLSALFTQ